MTIFFDIEWTIVKNDVFITQLAYIINNENKSFIKNFYFSVPCVSNETYAICGKNAEELNHLSNGKSFEDFAEEVAEDFSKANLLVSHNFSIDCFHLRNAFEKTKYEFTYNNSLCSMRLFKKSFKMNFKRLHGYSNPSLKDVMKHAGITENMVKQALNDYDVTFHNALFDVKALSMCCKHFSSSNDKNLHVLKALDF